MSSIQSSPHTVLNNSVTRMMLWVVMAMIPAFAAHFWFFGWGIVINSVLCLTTALSCEAIILRLRKRPLLPFLSDGSAIVTALLIAAALPPILPWWLPVLATAFAIIIAKHLYGGLGYNPFNPAMVGYAMLLIAFPRQMTAWLPAIGNQSQTLSLAENLRFNLFGELPSNINNYDVLTQATPLDVLEVQIKLGKTVAEIETGFIQFSDYFGIGWDWISLLFLAGGLLLIYKRIITWHIPVAVLATIGVLSGIAYLYDNQVNPSPLFHLLGGASMIGAFFIATDPVTASTTPRGRIIYGIGIGTITYVIRKWGGYPDGIAFGVLLMNMVVPTIDYYTQPRVFGHKRQHDE